MSPFATQAPTAVYAGEQNFESQKLNLTNFKFVAYSVWCLLFWQFVSVALDHNHVTGQLEERFIGFVLIKKTNESTKLADRRSIGCIQVGYLAKYVRLNIQILNSDVQTRCLRGVLLVE